MPLKFSVKLQEEKEKKDKKTTLNGRQQGTATKLAQELTSSKTLQGTAAKLAQKSTVNGRQQGTATKLAREQSASKTDTVKKKTSTSNTLKSSQSETKLKNINIGDIAKKSVSTQQRMTNSFTVEPIKTGVNATQQKKQRLDSLFEEIRNKKLTSNQTVQPASRVTAGTQSAGSAAGLQRKSAAETLGQGVKRAAGVQGSTADKNDSTYLNYAAKMIADTPGAYEREVKRAEGNKNLQEILKRYRLNKEK